MGYFSEKALSTIVWDTKREENTGFFSFFSFFVNWSLIAVM